MTNLVINMSGLPKQQYISWKGTSSTRNYTTNSAVPSNSNPASIQPNSNQKFTGKANPLKQWRKQLRPAQGVSYRKVSVSQVMDRPGGSTHLVNNQSSDCSNCPQNMKNYISKDSQSTVDKCYQNCYTDINGKQVSISNPARIQRPASTIINKKYYTTSTAYLKSRVRLYEQNQTLSNRGIESTGYNSTSCCSNDSTIKVYYKPNNPNFSKEGAVTSSNRIVKLNYDTIQPINKENECCNNNELFDRLSKDALQYRGNFEAPYYLKSKYELPENQCQTKRSIDGRKQTGGVGIHTVCFKTLGSDLQHKKGTLLSSMIGPGTGKLITQQLNNQEINKLCQNASANSEIINKLKLPCSMGKGIPINKQEKGNNGCNC